jgi:hypothetical protein
MSFSDYKKKSKLGSLTDRLVEKFNKMEENSGSDEDSRKQVLRNVSFAFFPVVEEKTKRLM